MQKQFTPCPACGAVGEVGTSCQFCGTTILLKENIFATAERIPSRRTVTPQQYAEKISIYHNIEPIGDGIYMVSIGKQYGVVNIDGDLIYPLGNYILEGVSSNPYIIAYGSDTEGIKGYVNLETIEYANEFGLVEDKNHPKKLYRVNIKDWKPINFYISSGIECNYDFLEYVCKWEISEDETKTLYYIYYEDKKSLWIADWKDIPDQEEGYNVKWQHNIIDNIKNFNVFDDKLIIETIDGNNIILDGSELDNMHYIEQKLGEGLSKSKNTESDNDNQSEHNSNEVSDEDNSELKVVMIIVLCAIVAFVLMFALIPS